MDLWWKIGISVLMAILSGLFYRFGGIGKPFKSWMRDWICPIFSLVTLLLWWQPNVWWGWFLIVPVYGLMGGAFSTYWDWLFNGVDNFYCHGFFVGLSIFPFCFSGLAWWLVLIQAILTGISMGLWCAKFSNDWVEECGRGFFASIFRVIA